jgi:PAS domain S-box-containing protein
VNAQGIQLVTQLLSGGLAVVLFAALYPRRHAPGVVAFGVLMVAVAIWSFSSAISEVADSERVEAFWFSLSLVGSGMLATAWLALAIGYTGRGEWLTRRKAALLAIEPTVAVLAAWVDTARAASRLGDAFRSSSAGLGDGFLFAFHNAYSYVLVVIGLWLFVRAFRRGHQIYSRQATSVAIAVLGPSIANLLVVLDIWAWDVDPTPAAASVGGLALVWGLFWERLFDVIPVAREAVIEGMQDGVIVLDDRGRIVDVNAAASAILGVPASELVGRGEEAATATLRAGKNARGDEITVVLDGRSRSFELRRQALRDGHGASNGSLLFLHDVSATKEAETRCGRRWHSST